MVILYKFIACLLATPLCEGRLQVLLLISAKRQSDQYISQQLKQQVVS